MKALSLWQPWATGMAAAQKFIETRDWRPYGLRRGDVVAIHAAKRWDQEEFEYLLDENPFIKRGLQLAERRGLWSFQTPPRGAIIAIARFYEAIPTDLISRNCFQASMEAKQPARAASMKLWVTDREKAWGNYAPGRWGWVFDAVRPIKPIPVSGKQGIWNWPTLDVPIAFLEERSYSPWAEEVLNGQQLEAMPS